MNPRFLLLLLLVAPCVPLGAYAGFDDVLIIEPSWTALPSEPLAAAAGITYRVTALDAGRVIVELRNPGGVPVAARLRLPAYQPADAPDVDLRAEAGATAAVEIAVRRADRDCTENAVRFSRIAIDGKELALRPAAGQLPPSERAFAVRTAWESPAFRPELIAYTAVAADAGTIDLHLLNRSAQAVHAEFAVLGWQPADAVNPRLHLLPGSTTEVLVRGEAVDARVTAATLAVWAVRVGADAGPELGSGPADHRRFAPIDAGWSPIAGAQDGLAGFNPRTLVQRVAGGALEIRNRSSMAVGADIRIAGGPPRRIDLAAEATTRLPGPVAGGAPAIADRVRLAGEPVVAEPLSIAPPPANALAVVASPADPLFNPLTVVYAIARQGDGQARVTIVNRAAIDLHCAWRIPAYQEPAAANPRLHLPAGASVTAVVALHHTDARLPLAQLAVSEVRLGADAGALLCAPSAAASR